MTGRIFWTAVLLATLFALPASVMAAPSWTLSAYPSSIKAGVSTAIDFTVTNTGDDGGGSEIACVRISTPLTFHIESVSIVSIRGRTLGTAFDAWQALWPGGSTVTFKNPEDKYPLVGSTPPIDRAVFRIRGTAPLIGALVIVGAAYQHADAAGSTQCGSGALPSLTLTLSVVTILPTPSPSPAPTPTHSPNPTKTPTPTASPSPAPTSTPRPTATVTPVATPPVIPLPTLTLPPLTTPSPSPNQTASTSPTATPTQPPGASLSPAPSVEATSSVAPSPSERPSPSAPSSPAASPAVLPTPEPGGGNGGGLILVDDAGGSGGTPNGTTRQEVDNLGPVVSVALESMPGGVIAWSYPALALSVPGLLLVIAVIAQAMGAFAWIPVVRRSLRGVGVGDGRGTSRRPEDS